MTFQSGDYWLYSVYGAKEKGRLHVAQFYDELLLVSVDCRKSVTVTKARDDSSNKYIIQFYGHTNYFQSSDYENGLRVQSLPGSYEWVITEVGSMLISTEDKDISWRLLKDAGEESSTFLSVTDGTPGELWFFSKAT
ncbi:hypothetical protein RhiLY_08885 [Ceratobasidium sp. AG-Ba]|nr:hypothetical protein RhiLY_08885 [Ceratobasidium sp. AG-Ba]